MSQFPATSRRDRGHLLRVLGTGFGLAVIVGNTIGAGILRTPGEIAAQLPGVSLFLAIWVVGGLYVLVNAISIAELGTMIPRSGGQYVFAHRALGDYAGFIVGWSDWVSTCGTTAAVSIVVAEYAGGLFAGLAGHTVAVAVAVAIAMAVLQWHGIRWGSTVQNTTSLLKALGFLLLIAACFVLGGSVPPGEPAASPVPAVALPTLAALIVSLQAVIYTYDGWTGVVYFSEEVVDPARDIPRALFGGVLAVIAIYLLMNLAVLYVLPLSRIAGEPLAAGLAAQTIFGRYGDTVIRSLMIVSMISGINAYHLMATRVIFTMSRDGLVSDRIVRVNAGGTPTTALLISTLVAVAFIMSGTFKQVISVLAVFFVFNYALSFVSVIVLRRREPDTPRPVRVWLYPWPTVLSLAGSVAFLVGVVVADPRTSVQSLVLLALSWPAFRLSRRFRTGTVA
jgi:APA family basic amino acid/polyamine antiporter